MCCIIGFTIKNKTNHFRKPINNKYMELLPLLDLGKPNTKSIDMSTQGSLGIGRGVYNP